MKYRYLKLLAGHIPFGKKELTKSDFATSVQAGDTIIDLETMSVFDKETNSWKEIEGDK